jgi:hypothetical protein
MHLNLVVSFKNIARILYNTVFCNVNQKRLDINRNNLGCFGVPDLMLTEVFWSCLGKITKALASKVMAL